MCMTLARSSSFLGFVIAVFVCAASTHAQSINWPKTFNGQPDFDFDRTEVVIELENKKEELGFDPYVATVGDLLAEEPVDPFDPKPRYRKDKKSGNNNPFLPPQLVESEALANTEDASLTALLPANDVSAGVSLDVSKTDETVDLSEFEAYLTNLVERKGVHFTTPDLSTRNLSSELAFVRVQSVVTSPEKYAILNRKKYRPGDRFTLRVKVKATPVDIEPMLEKHMPPRASIDSATWAKYEAIKAKILEDYAKKAEEKAKEAKGTYKQLPIIVKRVEHRAVVLRLYEREYRLKMKWGR